MNTLKFFSLIFLLLYSCTVPEQDRLIILETTDVHGSILPYDFIERKKNDNSLANVSTFLKKLRKKNSDIILLDNGDNLQGQPAVYYFNFIDTVTPHLNAEVMNYLCYDAATVGNHDIEAGHPVYDRLIADYNFPLLAANAVNKITEKPYFNPYVIIEKSGLKVAVFGLITPAIPNWLPPELYSGIEFRDMLETAKKWMPVILDENPDLVVGLFHSGWDESVNKKGKIDQFNENGSSEVAYLVPGFDIIFNGHDHKIVNKKIINISGDTVLILNGGSRAEVIAQADIFKIHGNQNNIKDLSIKGSIVDLNDYKPDYLFIRNFAAYRDMIKKYVNRKIATSTCEISSRDALFGSSAFVDLIHKIQLQTTGAQISFAAPLSFDVKISKGPLSVGDLFKLYRYENILYTVLMTGEEIKNYLEYSCSLWFNEMNDRDDPLLKFRSTGKNKKNVQNGKVWLKNQVYNFDSAAGIDYIVDASKPDGLKIKIISLAGGEDFDFKGMYKVAVNSFRGNGGGGHFIRGAGIDKNELKKRLIASTDNDLRYYILKELEMSKVVNPVRFDNWKIIPEEWMETAMPRDYRLLFGEDR